MRRTRQLLASTTLMFVIAGCGSGDSPRETTRSPRPAPATRAPEAAAPTTTRSCAAPSIPQAVGPVTDAARRALTGATRRTTATAHRFRTRAMITTQRGLTARAEVVGAAAPTGTSTAHLRWEGAAALLLPDLDLQTRGNRLLVGVGGAPKRHRGSASGIALDVGRELHTHPFLLDLDAATTTGGRTVIGATARAAELREYAGTERQGLATELLVGARRLAITTVIDDGRMTADTFTLVTQVPPRFQRQLGRGTITVRATTAYCFAT